MADAVTKMGMYSSVDYVYSACFGLQLLLHYLLFLPPRICIYVFSVPFQCLNMKCWALLWTKSVRVRIVCKKDLPESHQSEEDQDL